MAEDMIEMATQRLAAAIRESEEYILYSSLREAVMSDDTNRALLKESQKAQTALQMAAMAGKQADADAVQRFSQLSASCISTMSGPVSCAASDAKLAGDVFGRLAAAAGLEFICPGMKGVEEMAKKKDP